MYAKTVKWPEGKKSAVMVSVNLDAEYWLKIYYPDEDIEAWDSLPIGQNGMNYYLPRLLDVLDRYGIKASFFIPADVARRYPDKVKEVAARGHEIGCHGDKHENLALLSPEEQEKVLKCAKETLKDITGYDPVGFRMPEGEITAETLKIVKKLGFKYSSSLADSDIPYIFEEADLLELPVDWATFDLPYFAFVFDPSVQHRITPSDDVLVNFKTEFEGSCRWGTLFNLQLDPTTIGEKGRVHILDELFGMITAMDDVWIATGKEMYEFFGKEGL
ncbi:MAG: polysaccharide deacetylase [Firmicutes bacterium]|nr:polysaccharide deacetylase [Bacillota bacterium]